MFVLYTNTSVALFDLKQTFLCGQLTEVPLGITAGNTLVQLTEVPLGITPTSSPYQKNKATPCFFVIS